MKPFFAILLRELMILKKRLLKQVLSFTVPPVLFLVTFGWGFRDKVAIDGVPYITFILPGIIAMSSMRQSFSLSTDINISRFYWRTFDEIRSTPITDFSYTAGEVLSGVLKGWLATVVILILSFFFIAGIPLNVLFVLSVTLNTFIFSSIAVITSMLVKSHADQGMLNNFVITPMAFLCGTFFPLDIYPGWVRWIVYILPLTHSARTIRAASLGDPFPYHSLVYMVVVGALCFVTGVKVIKKSKD
jgi:Nod factor-specific ABC transporter NodJ protein